MPYSHGGIARESLAPIVTSKTDANVSLAATGAGTWADVDSGGNASARPMDLVFPACSVGQWVTITPSAIVAFGATSGILFDAGVYVSGVLAHKISGGSAGVSAWTAVASVATTNIGPPRAYQIQAGDLENIVNGVGSLRVRLMYQKTSGTAGTITANGTGGQWVMEGRGPFA